MVCDTVYSDLADAMREDRAALTEVIIDAGQMMMMLEQPDEVNEAIGEWLERAIVD